MNVVNIILISKYLFCAIALLTHINCYKSLDKLKLALTEHEDLKRKVVDVLNNNRKVLNARKLVEEL